VDSCRPKASYIKWGPDPHIRRGNFEGKKGLAQDMSWTCLTVDIVNATQQGRNWYGVDASWGVPDEYTLAPPGKYD